MAHIDLQNEEPGIRGLMVYSPHTAEPLNALAEILLRNEENSLDKGDRELIAAHVSHLNDCYFCENVHGAMAGYYMQCSAENIAHINADVQSSTISEKMKRLLSIAGSVQRGGKYVTTDQIHAAKEMGATDREIHDTVLIAAAFCMFNRYVDGLGTWAPQDKNIYAQRAPLRAREGYRNSISPNT